MKPTFALPVLIFLLTLAALTTLGQTNVNSDIKSRPTSKNTVYCELFGNAIGYSINYDRLFIIKEKHKTALRIGLSYFPPVIPPEHFIIIPLELTELLGNGNYFEFGVGSTFFYQLYQGDYNGFFGNEKHSRGFVIFAVGRLGYRYQREYEGIFIKAGLTPMIKILDETGYENIKSFIPYLGGIGIGYTFR